MSSTERRTFSRITFDADTSMQQGGDIWAVTLLDISLKGLLIEKPDDWSADPGKEFHVSIHLSDSTSITMTVSQRHEENNQIGFECNHIDIDSIHHLRRLVELNIGDMDLLEREVAALGK